eukprot:m.182552 g.182552  ORF g.182552 m.182552 type:complete len:1032 (-) comp16888_c1_seq2:1072-4167(-)
MFSSRRSRRKKKAAEQSLLVCGHVLIKKAFKKPMHCQFCNDLLWGIKTGLCCRYCRLVVHEKCAGKLSVQICATKRLIEIETPSPHSWCVQRNKKKYYCGVCRRHLDHDMCLVCTCCGLWAHLRCHTSALEECKPSALHTLATPEPQQHHWVEGNLSGKALCSVCKKSASSTHCLFGFQCRWCLRVAHPGCRNSIASPCDMGPLRDLILPPQAVFFTGPAPAIMNYKALTNDDILQVDEPAILPEQWHALSSSRPSSPLFQSSSARSGSPRSGSPRAGGSPRPGGRGTDSPRNGKRPLSRQGSLGFLDQVEGQERDGPAQSGQDEVRLQVYEGMLDDTSVHAHVAYEVTVPSNYSVSAVLDAVIMEMGLADSSSKYYLVEVELDMPEADLNSLMLNGVLDADVDVRIAGQDHVSSVLRASHLSERQHSNHALRYYIRSQEVDQELEKGSTVIRLRGPKEKGVLADKSICVARDADVQSVLAVALTKFDLEGDPSQWALRQVVVSQGTPSQVLQPEDKVFDLAMTFYQGNMQRSLLRYDVLPAQSVAAAGCTLYIVGLPTGLSAAAGTDLLRQGLATVAAIPKDSFTVVLVQSQHGVALVEFSSSEIVSHHEDAIQTCLHDQGYFDDLQLHWIPEIYPSAIPDDCTPLLVFVNPKSGGGQGPEIYCKMGRMLNRHQVVDLSVAGPMPGLLAFRRLTKFGVLAAGGDGTVGWVLSMLEDINYHMTCKTPPVAILPVGTGNDLSRIMNWGPGYAGEKLFPILQETLNAHVVALDRWQVTIAANEELVPPRSLTLANYMGIGIDASIALDFHKAREEHPERFSSRTKNKGIYVLSSMDAFLKQPCKEQMTGLSITADGKVLDLKDYQGILLLNINSWGGGATPWSLEQSTFFTPSYNDGYIEVVGVHGVMHMSHIALGVRTAKRLGQFREVCVKVDTAIPIHIDGEPWMQDPGTIELSPRPQQARMMVRRPKKPTRRISSSDLLEVPRVDSSSSMGLPRAPSTTTLRATASEPRLAYRMCDVVSSYAYTNDANTF